MTKGLLFTVCIAALCCSSGCVFPLKGKRPKESSAISADVEESFRRRWMEKRIGELTTQGVAAEAARVQAETEFRERFAFTRAAQK
jgi:hypothetical protein